MFRKMVPRCELRRTGCRRSTDQRPNIMSRVLILGFVILLVGPIATATAQSKRRQPSSGKIFLRERWAIRSSAQVKEKGDALSQGGFQTRDWYPARVPSTVAGTL